MSYEMRALFLEFRLSAEASYKLGDKQEPRVEEESGCDRSGIVADVACSRSEPKEYLFPAIIGVAVCILSSVPYLFAYLNTCPGKQFSGFVFRGENAMNGYLMFAKQAQDGYTLFEDKLTPEPTPRTYFNFEWWLFGRVARWTGWSLITVFHISRILMIFLLAFSVYFLCAQCLDSQFRRRFAFALVVFGSGLGWILWSYSKISMLVLNALGLPRHPVPDTIFFNGMFIPILRDVDGASLIAYFTSIPHIVHATSFAVLNYALLLVGERTGRRRYFLLAGLCALIHVQIRPYAIPEILFVYVLYPTLLCLRERRWDWNRFRNYALAATMLVPAVFYYAYLAHANVLGVAGWERRPLYFVDYILWGGLPVLLVFLDFTGLGWFRHMTKSSLLLTVLVVVAFVIGQAWPYLRSGDEAIATALWVAAPILATQGPIRRIYRCVVEWSSRARSAVLACLSSKKFRIIGAVVLVLCCTPSSAVAYARMMAKLVNCPRPFYVEHDILLAIKWLEANTNPSDVVLASYDTSSFIPRFARNKVCAGHDMITTNYLEKNELVFRFFSSRGDDKFKRQVVSRFNVRYVLCGPWEQSPGGMVAAEHPWLKAVYSSGRATIYEVRFTGAGL